MATDINVEKGVTGVDHYEISSKDGSDTLHQTATMGTIKLNEDELLLVPAPSSDPRGVSTSSRTGQPCQPNAIPVDPLNLPRWHKILIVVLLSACEYHTEEMDGDSPLNATTQSRV